MTEVTTEPHYQLTTNDLGHLVVTSTVDPTNKITIPPFVTDVHFHKTGLVVECAKVSKELPASPHLVITIPITELNGERIELYDTIEVWTKVNLTPLLFKAIEDIRQLGLRYVLYR